MPRRAVTSLLGGFKQAWQPINGAKVFAVFIEDLNASIAAVGVSSGPGRLDEYGALFLPVDQLWPVCNLVIDGQSKDDPTISIILVDFIELRRRQGAPLSQAVIDAGAIRFRPMLLTAAAVVVGASVILTDPIFLGLAVSLIAGAVASTFLSWPTIPKLYYLVPR